jgi:hypothetical protein
VNSSISFTLSQSGSPFVVPNHLVATSIDIAYTVAGAPDSLSVVVEGLVSATGEVAVLDTYTDVVDTTRTITFSDPYDRFRVTSFWSGGVNVSVGAVLTSSGPGPTWSASTLPAIQNRPF